MTDQAHEPVPDLAAFQPDLDRGKSIWVEAAWRLMRFLFIESTFPWPISVKKAILLKFGASIGTGFYIRPGVKIHFPWRLKCGSNVWIGDGSTILNLAQVTIEDNVAVAHEVYIAAAGHDIESVSFSYANFPITVREGAWLATRSFIGPGVTVGRGSVVAAGAVVTKDVADWKVVGGVPAVEIGRRKIVRASR